MATYALQNPARPGAQLAFSTPASGDTAPAVAGAFLLVVNPAANGTVTVSPTVLGDDGLTVVSPVVSVPQATTWVIPLDPVLYGPAPALTYTGTLGGVQVAAIVVPPAT